MTIHHLRASPCDLPKDRPTSPFYIWPWPYFRLIGLIDPEGFRDWSVRSLVFGSTPLWKPAWLGLIGLACQLRPIQTEAFFVLWYGVQGTYPCWSVGPPNSASRKATLCEQNRTRLWSTHPAAYGPLNTAMQTWQRLQNCSPCQPAAQTKGKVAKLQPCSFY